MMMYKAGMNKAVVSVLAASPLFYLAVLVAGGDLGPDPAKKLALLTGDWVICALLLTLSISTIARQYTPARGLLRWRRMAGLWTFFYASLHVMVFVALILGFDGKVLVAELQKRPYITVGFLAWFFLLLLAITSSDRAVRALGKKWKMLHRLVYPALLLALFHVIWQVRSDWSTAFLSSLAGGLLLLERMKEKMKWSLYTSLRRLFVSAPVAEPVDLRGKRIIVTGTSPGSIGFATAQTLARWGARVIITTRSDTEATVAALRAASGGEVQGHGMDLTDASSVKQFSDWYIKTQGEQLDVLINNAGIHLDLRSQWETPHLSADGVEIHWRTNYLGTSQLTHLLLPLLCKTAGHSGDARVVNVVSMLHTRGNNAGLFQPPQPYNSWVAYGLSKLALVHATFEIQRRYGAQQVQAYCLHPGAVFTHIADKGLEGHSLLLALRKKLSAFEKFFLLTPEEGAQTQIYCATRPGLQGGLYYQKCRPAQASPQSLDTEVSARLWEAPASFFVW